LSAQAEDTKVVHEYVLQHDQTDLELLAGRAHRIGFEVVVEGKILHFRPRKNDAGAALTLARDEDLVEFCPRLTTLGQAGEVEVRRRPSAPSARSAAGSPRLPRSPIPPSPRPRPTRWPPDGWARWRSPTSP